MLRKNFPAKIFVSLQMSSLTVPAGRFSSVSSLPTAYNDRLTVCMCKRANVRSHLLVNEQVQAKAAAEWLLLQCACGATLYSCASNGQVRASEEDRGGLIWQGPSR